MSKKKKKVLISVQLEIQSELNKLCQKERFICTFGLSLGGRYSKPRNEGMAWHKAEIDALFAGVGASTDF